MMIINVLNSYLFSSVSFWCSIRVAVAFVGFLGMVAHYSQKISVGIALVCMVNHSAIDHHQYQNAVVTPLSQTDIDCPRLHSSAKLVNNEIDFFSFCIALSSDMFLGRSISLDKTNPRTGLRWLFLGIFNH